MNSPHPKTGYGYLVIGVTHPSKELAQMRMEREDVPLRHHVTQFSTASPAPA